MSKKILIVGGVAGGAATAVRLRRLNEKDQIIMFDKGPHVSFSNCCIPYHLSGVIKEPKNLILLRPEHFSQIYNIDARVFHEVLSINRLSNEVTVKSLLSGRVYTEKYDKLVLSPGAKPLVPPIHGIENISYFTLKTVVDVDLLSQFIKRKKPSNITVIGGGFIGIEAAENLAEAGYKVTVVEALPQVLCQFDHDMIQIIHKELHDNGIDLVLSDKVSSFEENIVLLESGKKIRSQVVVFATGIKPETKLAIDAGLDIGTTGCIKVDDNYRTNDKNIYAIGDVIEVYGALLKESFSIPLAGPAQKQARQVADHINGLRVDNRGYIGSSVVKVFTLSAACTGLSEDFINSRKMDIAYQTVKVIPSDKVSIMPNSNMVHFKLIYQKSTGRILGAQAIGKGNITKRIDIIATIIKLNGTVDDLKDLELCYSPPYGTAKDVVNHAGYVASNLMQATFKQVHDYQMRDLVDSNTYLMDVRGKREFSKGHLKNSVNIPFSQFRDRIEELPREKKILIICRTGQNSYNVAVALQQVGFKDVYNVCGGFMGISFYEYFADKTLKRDPIVTKYNFD